MKRSPIKRKAPPMREATQTTYTPRPRMCGPLDTPKTGSMAVHAADGKARMCVPVPKAIKAKPGRRAPTVEEKAWMNALVAYGCIACRMDGYGFVPAAVHHILRGGQRMGHMFTLPLCDPGHHQNGGKVMISRHPWKARFERMYGTESVLLTGLRAKMFLKSERGAGT